MSMSKDIVSLTVECNLSSLSSFIDMLEFQQSAENSLFERKSIRTTIQDNTLRNRCVVCLFGVKDSLAVMISIARQLKTVSTIHNSPIFLKALSVTNQEQHS